MNDDSFIIWRAAPTLRIRTQERVNEAEGQRKSSQLWDQYLSDHPHAWNGPLLQLVEADENQLIASESDYRTYVESRARIGSCRDVFLAVTGVLFTDAGFLIGRRSASVHRPGAWEFAPAGGLEAFPIEEQLLREINEELNLDSAKLSLGEPMGIHLDGESSIADIVVPVKVLTPWQDIEGGFLPGEYERLEVRSVHSLLTMLEDGSAVDALFRRIVLWIQSGLIPCDTRT